MGQHAKRFDAVAAPKGSGLHAVAVALKVAAETVEQYFDPNSPEVTGAMQRWEQGLALLSTSNGTEPAPEPKKTSRRAPKAKEPDGAAGDSEESAAE